jgi:hypothetical protein
MVICDEIIIQEAIRLVNEGVSVTFPVKGNSMRPFIIGGHESIILQKPQQLRVGLVVLAWVDGTRYVVHRIIRIDGEHIILMGDGNIGITEHCTLSDIKALATHVVDVNGKSHTLYNKCRRWAASLWFHLQPIRRYLLWLHRHTYGALHRNGLS